ncbi:MAG: GumC family protein [Chitinophagaceae bacterium]
MQSQEGAQNAEQNLLAQLRFRYFPYWPLFLALMILFVTAAWAYIKITVPLYESSASILIKDERKGVDDSKMIESLNLISTKKIVENEIEVLKSRSLMNEVVKNLFLYAPVYQKGKWVNHSAYSISPVKIEAKDPNTLRETKKVYFKWNAQPSGIIINQKLYPADKWVTTPYGELKFNSTGHAQKEDQYLYFSLVNPKKITLGLVKKLKTAAVSKLSTVVSLKIRDEVPLRAEDILNSLIKVYSNAAVRDRNSLAANTLAFLEDRLAFVAHGLDSIERRLQQYKSRKGAVDISSQGQLFLQNVSANDQKVSDVNTQLAAIEQVEKYVQSKNNKDGIVPSSLGITDPLLSQLLTKLNDAELQYEKLKKTTGENSHLLVSIADQVEKLKPSILENIQSQRRSLQASKSNLYATNNNYSSLLQTIPKKERDLVEISRQHAIQSNIYSFLVQKREEAALSNSSTVADNRLVDTAESSLLPVSPNKKIIYLISIILALGLGIAIITGKDLLGKKILYRSEIEALTSFPIIGEIGFQKTQDPVVIGEGNNSLIAQQFRKLRASLTFIGIGAKRKKILITSTIAGEGKSFAVANLGLSLALTGKKVVVVELDLTNPSLSAKLGINARVGMATYLAGENDPEEIIKRTEASANLFIIPAGVLPHNPSELIMSERLPVLLNYLEGIFDYVLIDTAPVGALSDAYVVAPLCDATLYIIRHAHTPKIVVQRLDKTNKINELKNIVIVFNGVRSRGFSKDSYGYGYGYEYNVGYSKNDKLVENRN